MRADDAADTISELPQRRRQPVLDLLPAGQRTKVLTLMGFNPTSAGGLMGMDFLAVSADAPVGEALAAVSGCAQPAARGADQRARARRATAGCAGWSSWSRCSRPIRPSG